MTFRLLNIPLLLIVWLTGCRPAPTSPAAPVGKQPLTLLVSGDTAGWIVPCGCTSNQSGGLARRATYLQELRSRGDVVALDVGGAGDGAAPYQSEKFKAILQGEKLMGVAAHNLGATEIACGLETLQQFAAETETPFVSCNVFQGDNKPAVETFRLIEAAGRKLLITGVVGQNFPPAAGLVVRDPIESVLAMLELTTANHDALIVLAYLPEKELRQLAERLPEANMVVGGPTGQTITPVHVGRTLLTSATNKGKFLAQITLPVNLNEPLTAQIIETGPSLADEAQQIANLKEFRRLLAERDFTAAESGLLANSRWKPSPGQQIAGTQACQSCHVDAHQVWKNSGHAHAWDRLVQEGAHVDSACQQCHVTGFGLAGGFLSAKTSPLRVDVGCENCHGPSQAHALNPKVKTPFDAQGSCTTCHDHENSPHFNFDSYWEQIKHE